MFSVKTDTDIKPTSIKEGEKIYMNTEHFLPFARFLPKKPGEKGQSGGKGRGGSGSGNRGRGRGGRGGGGNRGGNNRGNSGGYRPPRGGSGSSGGYRPPRGGQQHK